MYLCSTFRHGSGGGNELYFVPHFASFYGENLEKKILQKKQKNTPLHGSFGNVALTAHC